jgi:hypothetical protein
MAGGNKKHKRGSIPSQSSGMSVSPKKELIERTADNDYGVLSDPDEQTTSTIPPPTPLSMNHEIQQKNSPGLSPSSPDRSPLASNGVECIDNQDELLPPLHSSQHSSPQMSPLSPSQPLSTQLPISQSPTSNKSLDTLKLKLTRDKNFSRKITLHTFFSYIILAMEIQRSCSASIAQLCVKSVQDLVIYMIDNHSCSNSVRIYLHTLNDTGVVKNIIESIIEFNKDNIETLYTLEENELEMCILQSANTSSPSSAAPDVTATATTSVNEVKVDATETSQHNSPQTSQKCGFFKRMRCCLFSGCCG